MAGEVVDILDIWVVKYALTQGVFKVKATPWPLGEMKLPSEVEAWSNAEDRYARLYFQRDIALSAKEAAQKVAVLRERKIKSAEKALKKLREQVIAIPE